MKEFLLTLLGFAVWDIIKYIFRRFKTNTEKKLK